VTIPWGDVYTAYLTTGIPDIRVYMAVSATALPLFHGTRWLGPVLRSGIFQRLARRLIDSRPAGPDEEQRQRGESLLWAEASDAAGERAVSRLRTPEGYSLTVDAALTIVARVLAGQVTAGFQTPAGCYGADLVLTLDGCSREDVDL
jgi:short subunit dehydrogenase-like uncharacterized protein